MDRVFMFFSLAVLLTFLTARSTAQTLPHDERLQEVVILGKQKAKKLLGRGTRMPGAIIQLTPDQIGHEIGSAITVGHTTEVKEIAFDILESSIEDAVLGIMIYRDNTFTPVLDHPIFVDVSQGKRRTITIAPDVPVLLEQGSYLFAISFVDCADEVKAQWTESSQWDDAMRYKMTKQNCMQFPLYAKESYMRSGMADTFEKRNFNIGLRVKGA